MEYLLSEAEEYNAKAYMIDVVPGGLEDGRNDGIALLEKHYYKKSNMDRLYQKWLEVVLHFSCYYPLETVLVTGLALPGMEDFMEQTPNQEGYYLEFPMESIGDLDVLSDLVCQKTFGSMTVLFPTLDMVFHLGKDDVYIIVTLKKVTEENQAAIELLRKLVEAQGIISCVKEESYVMSEMLLNGLPFDDYLEKYEIFEKTKQCMMEVPEKLVR